MKTHHSNNYNHKLAALQAAPKGKAEPSNNANTGDFDNLVDKENDSYEDKENISTTRIRLSLKKNKGGKRIPSLLKKVHGNVDKETDNKENASASLQFLKKPTRGKRLSLLKKLHQEKARQLPASGGNTIVPDSYPPLFSPLSKKSYASRNVQALSQPRSLCSPLSKFSRPSMFSPLAKSSSSSSLLPQTGQKKVPEETAGTSKTTPVPPPIRNLYHEEIGSFEVSESFEAMNDGDSKNMEEMFDHPFIPAYGIYDSPSMKDDGSNKSTTYSPIPLSSVHDDIDMDDDLVELMLGLEIFSDDA